MDFLDRVQGYLHEKARAQREVIAVPPFMLYLHLGNDDVGESWAMPHASTTDVLSEGSLAAERFFQRRSRTPHIQALDSLWPRLGEQLIGFGYTLASQLPVLICTADRLRHPDAPPLSMTVLSAESNLTDVAEGWTVNAQGFDPVAAAATSEEATEFRQSLITSRAVTAKLNGAAVGAGMFTEQHEGVTELVGITTLQPFRGRGIAAAVTASLTELAFANGADLTFLVAASPQASRVYQRVGYRQIANLMSWIKK